MAPNPSFSATAALLMRTRKASIDSSARFTLKAEVVRCVAVLPEPPTLNGARAIVETNGGGYGIGLAYARDMIHPG